MIDKQYLMSFLEPRNSWNNWSEVWGPTALLFGLGFSMFCNAFYGRNIGDVSCRYRVVFSPRRQAFGIWALIYTYFATSVFLQFLWSASNEIFPNAGIYANSLVTSAWVLAGAWVIFFARLQRLVLAALTLVAAAGLALASIVVQKGWDMSEASGGTRAMQVVALAVPNALFAGWLCVAAGLSVAIALEARGEPTLGRWELLECEEQSDTCAEVEGGREGGGEGADQDNRIGAALPLLCSAGVVAGVAVATRDPLLLLPAAWALLWQKRWCSASSAALAMLLVVGQVVVLVRMFI